MVAREVEAKWGLGHQESSGEVKRTHPEGGVDLKSETAKLYKPQEQVPGLKTLPPEMKDILVFARQQQQSSEADDKALEPGPVWLAPSHEVSPDPTGSGDELIQQIVEDSEKQRTEHAKEGRSFPEG